MKGSNGAAVAGLLLALVTPARADTLIDNVDGFTLREDGSVERLSGLLIGNDGRIVQVLHRGDKTPRADYRVDGKGRVLMPGLVDGHAAVLDTGFAALTLDLSPARTLAEAQARIAAYSAAHRDRPWLLGRGWDARRWAAGKLPSAADLDAAVADRPAWLISADGHSGWANSAALAAAGITAATKNPVGGRIERGVGGKPIGVLSETAMALIAKVVPTPRPEDRDLAFHAAQEAFLKRGITAVTDFGTTIDDWQTYRRAGDMGRLRLRVIGYAAGTEAMSLIGGPGPTPWLYEDRLKLNGVALTLDGALTTRGSWLKAGYADAPAQTGLPRMDPTQLRNLMSRAAIDRFQVAVVANGDAALATVLDAVGELGETYKGDRRWRVSGLQTLAPADLARLGSMAVTPIPAQAANADSGGQDDLAKTRLGPERAGLAWPTASAAKVGARIAFGSGAPAGLPDPFVAVATATARPTEAVPRGLALAAWTTGPAYAAFGETKFGRLAPGLRADFLLLDRDPTMVGAGELAGTKVLETWIGGQRVWAAPE